MATDSEVTGARSTLIRFAATGTPRRRVFCLPFAGGGPATYRLWPKSLPTDVDVIAIQLPGRDPSSRQRPLDSISDLVSSVASATAALHEDNPLPFTIFGHSMGALIAFELTVALERSGGPAPERLFVSGRRPPDLLHEGPTIHGLADDAFLDQMQALYGGVPDVIRNEPELIAMLLPALRADVRAFETYVPIAPRPVRCPMHVYGGVSDTHPTPSLLSGWQRFAEHPVTVRTFDGDHFYLNTSREALTSDIARHWTGTSPVADPS
jgi:medium-chain acyl-[acyl-carrier-protein] hydrolase